MFKLALLGCIGSGKSTTCEILSKREKVRLFVENFEDNPFIKSFYSDECEENKRSKNIFALQMWFLDEYLRVALSAKSYKSYIIDAGALAGLAFVTAQTNLKLMSKYEHDLYFSLWKKVFLEGNGLDRTCKYIIIDREVPDLMSKIAKRGRPHERDMKEFFIREVKESYAKLPKMLEGTGLDIRVMKCSVSESREMIAKRVKDLYESMSVELI